MRKVIASTFITLDGFMAGPRGEMDWNVDFFDEEVSEFLFEQYCITGTILLGRITYQGFAGYWPTAAMVNPYAVHMNNTPKIVFSRTLETVEWGKWDNVRLIKENIPLEIQKLKQQPGNDMSIIGSATLVQSFMNLGLIDEYRLLVHPVILGNGKPLFKNTSDKLNLVLINTRTFSNGVVLLKYQPTQLINGKNNYWVEANLYSKNNDVFKT